MKIIYIGQLGVSRSHGRNWHYPASGGRRGVMLVLAA
jgi:hypothetical protein